MKSASRREAVLWTALVWALSLACYLPMLLLRRGLPVPPAAVSLKYGFVLVPLGVSAAFAARRGELRPWLTASFSRPIGLPSLLLCALFGGAGLALSYVYGVWSGRADLWRSAYPTAASAAAGCVYLLITALLEELAWRGFLLRAVSEAAGKRSALVYTGLAWAVWHIPMWSIRNALGWEEIAVYFLGTLLLSLLFGVYFLRYGNVLTVSLLHMLFNTCFLAPMSWTIPLLGCLAAALAVWERRAGTRG